MIYPFTFVCARDWDCFEFLVESADKLRDRRLAPFTAFYDPSELPDNRMRSFASVYRVQFFPRLPQFSPWSDRSAKSKLDGFLQVATRPEVQATDDVVHIDSDCFFTSSKILDQVESRDGFECAGFEHGVPSIAVLDRPWTWTSGAFQVAEVGLVREMGEKYSGGLYEAVLNKMREAGLSTVNDDVVVSFIFALQGAWTKNLGEWGGVANLEAIALQKEKPRSLVHYANDTQNFLGLPNTPKWDFPKILRMRGIRVF